MKDADEGAEGFSTTDLVRLFVSGHQTHSLDEGVSWVVHPGLDGLVQREAIGRGLIAQRGVDGGRQAARHAVIVLPQVRILRTAQTQGRGFRGRSQPSKS